MTIGPEAVLAVGRDVFVDAAQLLIQTKGYERFSFQDVLDATATSKGAFYHYFAFQGIAHVKRIARPPAAGLDRYDWLDPGARSPYLIGLFVETVTVWHPIGV